ncbi:MAG TPA: penicillin acylase family protein [Flavipsychrobacter sp.]|nr:penicillin acylase family protein [Flavipsychrobacter sp.]
MRVAGAVIVTLLTAALVFILDRPMGSLPPLGRLLDPVSGWAANAESTTKNFNEKLSLKGLQQPVAVWFEERMVPHIQAQNDHDLYYTLGYVHASFRLWQMDMQTRASAGRVGEVVGEKIVKDPITGKEKNALLEFDRSQRRKGMVYAAENSLKAIEAEPRTKQMIDAYTAGINQYIASLSYKKLPLEYKLMSFEPEPWTNLKCALLMKSMADDLTGYTEDFPLTVLKDQLPEEDFELLFPLRTAGSIPVIPSGTKFETPSMKKPEVPEGDVWTKFSTSSAGAQASSKSPISHPEYPDYETGVGSNNWVISGSKTQSGAPILCNDPHLGLNLPALWFEVQLQAPGMNVYGVSLPGAPGVIIGFNDSISWGLTNNYRDVKDFYEIEKIDNSAYRFDGNQRTFDKKIEIIKIKGKPDFIDKVNYTLHGPVMYDETFDDPLKSKKNIALTWMAHRGTNELLSVYLLNKAGNYQEFTDALMHFQCPAQNFVYADRQNNIAMWGQGQFINKWEGQGRYVMKGNTSATLWGEDIPLRENPHVLNPPQQYLASANQMTTDSTYPYWYNGYFSDFREWRINELIGQFCKNGILYKNPSALSRDLFTMQAVQNDENSRLLKVISGRISKFITNVGSVSGKLTSGYDGYYDATLSPESEHSSFYQIVWAFLYRNIWEDDFFNVPQILYPKEERTMQLIVTDSNSKFYDDKRTGSIETLREMVQRSVRQTQDSLDKLKKQLGSLQWYKVKGTQLTHLAKIDAFSYKDLKIGGWGNTINAVKKTHGPSWRMIVEMGKERIRGYGIYPGGQSGNPGSKFYGTSVKNWVEGKYYNLLFLASGVKQKPREITYVWELSQ